MRFKRQKAVKCDVCATIVCYTGDNNRLDIERRKTMKTRLTVAFWLYLVAMITVAFFGTRHLLASQLPSYHIGAIGIAWQDLDQTYQVLFLGLLKQIGSFQLGFAIAGAAIALFPFRAKMAWANWVLLAMALVTGVISTYASLDLHLRTPASTPWFAPGISVVLALIGFGLSIGVTRSKPAGAA
jgi:hypothetical protein